jgi:hypothetical protein
MKFQVNGPNNCGFVIDVIFYLKEKNMYDGMPHLEDELGRPVGGRQSTSEFRFRLNNDNSSSSSESESEEENTEIKEPTQPKRIQEEARRRINQERQRLLNERAYQQAINDSTRRRIQYENDIDEKVRQYMRRERDTERLIHEIIQSERDREKLMNAKIRMKYLQQQKTSTPTPTLISIQTPTPISIQTPSQTPIVKKPNSKPKCDIDKDIEKTLRYGRM